VEEKMKKGNYNWIFTLVAILIVFTASPLFAAGDANLELEKDIKRGRQIFQTVCFICHGSTGEGDGGSAMFIGPYMHPRPNNFTMGVIKFRSTESGDMPTLKDLMRTIRNGIPGFMPSFRNLKGDGIRQVALYISRNFMEDELAKETTIAFLPDPYTNSPEVIAEAKAEIILARQEEEDEDSSIEESPLATQASFSGSTFPSLQAVAFHGEDDLNQLAKSEEADWTQSWFSSSKVQQEALKALSLKAVPLVVVAPKAKVYSKKGRLERGRKLFYAMQCVSCHGVGGRGAKTNMKDERGLPVMAADLSRPETLGNGHQPEDIYRTIMTGLNGTPMPSFSDLFIGEEEKVWDLVYYVLSLKDRKEASTF